MKTKKKMIRKRPAPMVEVTINISQEFYWLVKDLMEKTGKTGSQIIGHGAMSWYHAVISDEIKNPAVPQSERFDTN